MWDFLIVGISVGCQKMLNIAHKMAYLKTFLVEVKSNFCYVIFMLQVEVHVWNPLKINASLYHANLIGYSICNGLYVLRCKYSHLRCIVIRRKWKFIQWSVAWIGNLLVFLKPAYFFFLSHIN